MRIVAQRSRSGDAEEWLKNHRDRRTHHFSGIALLDGRGEWVSSLAPVSMIGSWLVLSASVWLTSVILPGFRVKGLGGALRVAALFGVLNWALGWLIFGAIGLATLGIGFWLAFATRTVVNAIVLKITDSFSDSLEIDGFVRAILAALLMSGIGTVSEALIRSVN